MTRISLVFFSIVNKRVTRFRISISTLVRTIVTDVIISKRGGMLQYAIAYSISRRLFRSLFPMRTFFVHIQLAVDHAIKKKEIIIHCAV